MTVRIGERILQAQVVKKAAEEQYEEAIAQGDAAIMLEQIQLGLYAMNVGNILAGEHVVDHCRPAKSAAPFIPGMPDKPTDWQDLMQASPEQVAQSQREMEEYWNLLGTIWAVLRKGGSRAYAKALKMLSQDDQEAWEEWVAEEEYQPATEGLREYLETHLRPLAASMHKEALYHAAIKKQALGEGLRPVYLQNLCRYEVHLDRKFERTLAMLIKLKELRGKT